jgi:2-iminobutanoate/2-iminopropanoate deaminase
MMEFVSTKNAPGAIGPYSQAVVDGGHVFTSGQVGLDPKTGEMVAGGVESETQQVLANLAAVLKEAGSGFQNVVKTSIFLSDMSDFKTVNRIYAEAMGDHRPARSTVQVAALPLEARVEIDMVARV